MSQDLVKHILQQHSIAHYGFAPLQRPLSMDLYKEWISSGFHADMNYLATHTEKKETPSLLLPKAKSAIVITHPYPEESQDFPLHHLKVAKYARGGDYHLWLKEKMSKISRDLKASFPDHNFLEFTDSSPVLERDLAYQASLGWIGKNSCLLSRQQGSYFLIAEIYTTLVLQSDTSPAHDHCGTCTRCIDSCPTGAIHDNRTLDAGLCISYWTIEAKIPPPLEKASQFQSWFFGCDICQDVCPWNNKVYGAIAPKPEEKTSLVEELRWILTSSNKELERTFHGTPLLRARGRGLKRNAMVVIANSGLSELAPEVRSYADHGELGKLALWTLSHLQS